MAKCVHWRCGYQAHPNENQFNGFCCQQSKVGWENFDWEARNPIGRCRISMGLAGTSQLPLMLLRGSQFWQFCPWIFWSNQQDLPSVREVFEIAKECTTVKLRHLLFEVEGLQSGSAASVAFYDIPLDSPTSSR